jgi:hypothetical protein
MIRKKPAAAKKTAAIAKAKRVLNSARKTRRKATRVLNSARSSSSSRRTAGRRRNGADIEAAAELSEQFHGRPARSVRDVTEVEHSRGTLSDLGRLVSLLVWIDEDNPYELTFQGVRLAASPDGGQLYLIGNQRLDLAALGLDKYMPKDHITVGAVSQVVYATSKAFHNFAPTEYEHEFGEEGGAEPMLGYDVLSEKFYLTGGSYQVRPEGIVN